MSATLVLIDMQQAMDDPIFARQGQPEALGRAASLLARWREQGNPIVHIRHDSMDPSSPYSPDRASNAFKPEVAPLDHETIVEKRTNNAFVGTDLMQVLEEIGSSELVICGVHLQDCVESTVRMAGNLGFMVYLAGDATVSLGQTDINGKKWSADDVVVGQFEILLLYGSLYTKLDITPNFSLPINIPNCRLCYFDKGVTYNHYYAIWIPRAVQCYLTNFVLEYFIEVQSVSP